MSDEPICLTRTQAAKLIDDVRVMLARREPHEFIEARLRDAGIQPLTRCRGEAHENPYIDNCLVCAPRWGLVGPKVKVR